MYYYPLQPPYVVLIVGLLIGVTCGAAFGGTLKLTVQKWMSESKENEAAAPIQTKPLLMPFFGITGGVGLFLSSGLEIFGFPPILANSVAIPMTLLTCFLVWKQLGSMLTFAQREGFQALDLDTMN